MAALGIRVQPCACMAIPEEIASALGMRPGALLSMEPHTAGKTLTLKLIERGSESPSAGYPACSLP